MRVIKRLELLRGRCRLHSRVGAKVSKETRRKELDVMYSSAPGSKMLVYLLSFRGDKMLRIGPGI